MIKYDLNLFAEIQYIFKFQDVDHTFSFKVPNNIGETLIQN